MKKIFAVLMMIVMLAVLPFAALAEETEVDTLLEGLVTEIVDGGFVMQDAEKGEVMLNTSDATVWDGLLAEGELAVGQYVFVEYDGRMTFSLPPQAHADRVVCSILTGNVLEVLEDGSILMNDDTFGEVIVRLGEGVHHVYAGMPVTVYYDGVMTLSLPGQVNASHIVLPELMGTVSSKTEEGFTLTDAEGVEYEILFAENTLLSEEVIVVEESEEIAEESVTEEADEETVTEEETAETADEPAAEEEIIGEEAAMEDAALAEEAAEAIVLPLAESDIEWADGDTVKVYYNGMMTRSIPAQVTALEVVVIR